MPATLVSSIAEARRLLQHHYGYPDFRPAQRRVLQSVLSGRDTLGILPTGGGKSLCFQIPALVLGGLTIVVSPLISLMQDQVGALQARGIPAELLNSTLSRERQNAILASLEENATPLLYTSPERLERLARELGGRSLRPRLLAVDEAHCIADWGHDFRPSYRKLRRLRRALGSPPAVALTASATPEVRAEIIRGLGLVRPDLHVGSFDRRNLWFGAVRVEDARHRLGALLDLLQVEDRVAIVYTPTRNLTEGVARALGQAGFRVAPYHAGLSKSARAEVLGRFLADELEIIVATCAFGMGIDKPNVRLVVHWSLPATPEAYYQEAGRAGRDGGFARCILLWHPDDVRLHRRQLEVTFPPERLLERIWHQRGAVVGVPANVLAAAERLRHELRPERGAVDWRPVRERRRRAESKIDTMARYAGARSCRRAALVGYFGESLSGCAGCDRCRQRGTAVTESPAVRRRRRALESALGRVLGPWGGPLLEPATIRGLALQPPSCIDELVEFPGVGPVLAVRFGGTILTALGLVTARETGDEVEGDPLLERLRAWRHATATGLGVSAPLVLTEETLRTLAREQPRSRPQLALVPGIGPRALAKWGGELLRLMSESSGD